MKPLLAIDTESKGGGSFGELSHVYCFSYSRNTKEGIDSGALALFWDTSTAVEESVYYDNYLTLKAMCQEHRVVFHNAAHDLDVLHQMGIEVPDWEDSMLLSYCAYPGREEIAVKGKGLSRHSLAAWGERLGVSKMEVTKNWDKFHLELIPLCEPKRPINSSVLQDSLLAYARVDADLTIRVWNTVYKSIDAGALNTYQNIDKPYVNIIRTMTVAGMYVDADKLLALQVEWGSELAKAEAEAKEIVTEAPQKLKKLVNPTGKPGHNYLYMEEDPKKQGRELYVYELMGEFNPNSGAQIAWALTKLYDWEPLKMTESGKPSTEYDVLVKLDYPLIDPLLRIAEFSKLIGTYAEPMYEIAANGDGYIHPSWNQAIAITGRLSCSSPNLQNVPTRTERGQELRKSVIAPEGYKLCGIDLQAIEYRVLASLMAEYFVSKDGVIPDDVQFMVDAFNTGKDIHTVMAELWFSTKGDYVGREKDYRKIGKNISYGNMFGFGEEKAGTMMGVTTAEAGALIAIANENNPSFPEFKESVLNDYKSRGGVAYGLYGRRFEYPDMMLPERGKDKWKLYRAQRQGFNAMIQGTAADILKLLQLHVSKAISPYYGAIQVGSIHDETLYLVKTDNADGFCREVTDYYRNNYEYLPYVCIDGECNYGESWYELK